MWNGSTSRQPRDRRTADPTGRRGRCGGRDIGVERLPDQSRAPCVAARREVREGGRMSELMVLGFENEAAAEEFGVTLGQMQKDMIVQLEDAAMVVRDDD